MVVFKTLWNSMCSLLDHLKIINDGKSYSFLFIETVASPSSIPHNLCNGFLNATQLLIWVSHDKTTSDRTQMFHQLLQTVPLELPLNVRITEYDSPLPPS